MHDMYTELIEIAERQLSNRVKGIMKKLLNDYIGSEIVYRVIKPELRSMYGDALFLLAKQHLIFELQMAQEKRLEELSKDAHKYCQQGGLRSKMPNR